MGLLLVGVMMLFASDNSEFIETSNEQIADGYEWTYVGKNTPSGSPALIAESNNESYILWRLEK